MNIALVVERLDPRRGGVEQWTWQFARWLAAAGHETHVVASEFAAEVQGEQFARHCTAPSRGRLQFAAAAETLLRALKLDVIHDTGCGWYCDVFQPHGGSWRASFEQNQLLAPPWRRPLRRLAARVLPRYRAFERLLARQYQADGRLFLALSQMTARDFRHRHGVPADSIRTIYNGVDVERFSPASRQPARQTLRRAWQVADHETVLLIVAHNFELKGVPTLVRAVKRCRAAGHPLRLVVAGGGRAVGHYRELANQARVGKAVHFLGAVDDPAGCYAAADLYVQPTYYDPCSLVVLEALAAGLPVITSRYNGAGELITRGREGDLIDNPADDQELAAALVPWLHPARRATASLAARQLALRHTAEHNFQEVLGVYQELCSGQDRHARQSSRAA